MSILPVQLCSKECFDPTGHFAGNVGFSITKCDADLRTRSVGLEEMNAWRTGRQVFFQATQGFRIQIGVDKFIQKLNAVLACYVIFHPLTLEILGESFSDEKP